MERDGAALPLVRHNHLEAEHVGELPLQRLKVWIDRPRVAGACAGDVDAPAWPHPLRQRLGLAHRKALGDDLARQLLGVLGGVDVIFCRNVLIYFDLGSRKRAVGHFHRKLAKGGYLLLGHSESLMNVSTEFQLVHLKHDMVYRKP